MKKRQLVVTWIKNIRFNKKQIMVLWIGVSFILPILFYWWVAYSDYKVEKRNVDFAAIRELAKLKTERDFKDQEVQDLLIEIEEIRKFAGGETYEEWLRSLQETRAGLVSEHGEQKVQEFEQNRQKRKEELEGQINLLKRTVSFHSYEEVEKDLEQKAKRTQKEYEDLDSKIKRVVPIMFSFYTNKFTTSIELNKALDKKNKKAIILIGLPIFFSSFLSLMAFFLYIARDSEK